MADRPLSPALTDRASRGGLLNLIERIGNALPDPATLFLLGTLLVMALSWVAAKTEWTVTDRLPRAVMVAVIDDAGQPVLDEQTGEPLMEPKLDEAGRRIVVWEEVRQTRDVILTRVVVDAGGNPVIDERTGLPRTEVVLDADGKPTVERVVTDAPVTRTARNLISSDGIFWALGSMVKNFVDFPPLGIVLVGMLGIGIAERTGLIAVLLKLFMAAVPSSLLTPAMVFIGIMSSMATDAGYVVLPPLAAALYLAVGRSPLAGMAAVFAGVSAGFSANLLVTGLDPLLAGFTEPGARVIDPDYAVNPACNWWFMIASTFVMTLTGWAVTAWLVERRLATKSPDEGGPNPSGADELSSQRVTPTEFRALGWSMLAMVATLGVFIAMIAIPGAPLHGKGIRFDRWAEVIVPMLFFCFVVPGIAFGVAMGQFKNDKDVAKGLIDTMATMAPIIVLAFFAAQFIEHFRWSGLDVMLAMAGGQFLGQAQMSPMLLIVAFIGITALFNLFVGSMSAKYALFAPIFVPMFMMVGIAPELTQAAYRVGDSVTNIVTPLNSYLIIILVFMQRYVPKGGMGTLIATMLPYSIVFGIVWTLMLLVWMALGIPLGPDGALWYDPATLGG